MVVAVALVDVLLEHGEDAHHADGLLPGAVDAVLVAVQHAQGVVGGLEAVEARLDEVFVDFHLRGGGSEGGRETERTREARCQLAVILFLIRPREYLKTSSSRDFGHRSETQTLYLIDLEFWSEVCVNFFQQVYRPTGNVVTSLYDHLREAMANVTITASPSLHLCTKRSSQGL